MISLRTKWADIFLQALSARAFLHARLNLLWRAIDHTPQFQYFWMACQRVNNRTSCMPLGHLNLLKYNVYDESLSVEITSLER